jgi:iron-sulfur cluster repair protein YtfE (RIC family)
MQTAKTTLSSYYDGGNALDLLRGQHREIDQLLGALERATLARDRSRLIAELGDLLAVHMAIEERVFYPGLTPNVAESADRTFVVLAVEDHFEQKRLLSDLLETGVENLAFEATVRRLHESVSAHLSAEERLFPRIQRRLSLSRLRRLAYEMRVLEFQLRTDTEPRRLVLEETVALAMA